MSNSINFDVLNNAAAMLFVTKGEQYQSQIIRLLCQYHGANTNESVLDVINTLLRLLVSNTLVFLKGIITKL